ncbi:MAG: FtsX-like permease family protein, partial [Verrucomicrobiota bacterium]|nr:FtsX-like permease family protein [Verrucomicrobiota bacterium]
MSLLQIVRRSLRQHLLSTVITAFSIALASGLLMSVWVVKDQAERKFMGVDSGFDAVVGPPGSKLPLVLNAIFHLESSERNLSWEQYEAVAAHPKVRTAVPLALGDNYYGYRLVGVTTNLFGVEYRDGEKYDVQDGGYVFRPDKKQAVVGSFVAERLGLKVGDKFHPYHGLTFDESEKHAEIYIVTGIMKPTNTPGDRVIWIPIKGLQNMEGHKAESSTEVSAVLVKLISNTLAPSMDKQINQQGSVMTFAGPIAMIVAQIFNKIAPMEMILRCVAVLVALVAAGSILASIYNSMNERRREIAILRALGARRGTVFGVVILESSSIAVLGALAGFVVYFIIMFVAAWYIRTETGIVLDPLEPQWVMLWAPLAMLVLGALAGLVPAAKAYSTNVAANL